jgi:hypothetical protein
MNNNFRIGALYDEAFKEMQPFDICEQLEAVAYNIEETKYEKNLNEFELAERKNHYSELGIILSEIAEKKKEAMEKFRLLEKEPKETARILLDAIRFKTEERFGKIFLVDDPLCGMMYSFDQSGVCVGARPLEKTEKQMKIKSLQNGN